VIDLKLKLSLTGTASDDTVKGKILIVRGPKGPIGVAVDKVIGVVHIPRSEILPPPSHLSEGEVKFIDGIAVVDKRFVSIINMPATMTLNLK
jgi:chemotaxis signal transduction protein